jgi:hypothetical protein
VIELPVGEEDRGGIGVQVWAVRDHQYLARSLAIAVPWDNKDLKVTFSTLRDKLRPGQKETWRVTVRGPQDNLLGTGMVELLAYMYDRSLDVFAPHSPPSIAGLYPSRSSIAYGRVNLDSQHPQWVYSNSIWDSVSVSSLSGDQLVFPDSYGIGGPGGRGGMGFGRMRMMAPGGAMPPPSPVMASPKSARAPAPEPNGRNRSSQSRLGQRPRRVQGSRPKRKPPETARRRQASRLGQYAAIELFRDSVLCAAAADRKRWQCRD